jgi:hypothetical protein
VRDIGVRYRRVVELDDAAAVDLAALVVHGLRALHDAGFGVSLSAHQTADALVSIGTEIAKRGSAGSAADAERGTDPELPAVTVETMSTTDIARAASVSDGYVRRACREGELHPYACLSRRGYRIEADAAHRWIDAHSKPSPR